MAQNTFEKDFILIMDFKHLLTLGRDILGINFDLSLHFVVGSAFLNKVGKLFSYQKNFLCVCKICFICNEYLFVSHKLHQNIGIQYPNLNISPVYIHGQKGEMLTVLKLLFHLFWPWLYIKDSNCHPPSLLFCLLNFVAKYFLATQLSLFPWTIL